MRGCPRDIIVKAMNCGIVVSEFVLQVALLRSLSGKYPWGRYEPPSPPSYGFNSTTIVLLEEKKTQKKSDQSSEKNSIDRPKYRYIKEGSTQKIHDYY